MSPSPTRPPRSTEWTVGGVPVVLKRSARRHTLALQVRTGTVTVFAPASLPLRQIEAFVESKRAWAEGHLSEGVERSQHARPLTDGSPLPFMGETLTLRLVPGLTAPERQGGDVRVAPGTSRELRAQVETWYGEAGLPALRALVEAYAQALGAGDRLRQVRLSRARSRWGSCTARGDIRVHWALCRAPREVAAYVALHEAAHLLELNHSPRYWTHVERLMPDHRQWRTWLRTNGWTLAETPPS
ncbi:M48 family metallopeptidase [Deinococcus hopiensis]|uniref:YgjP-like metallopeptidase domain-containing protein n=1 Tax=Deinococcus hopiensis KR-140 TaxID=695939 RepID=A0A1W1VRE8_9DEIO|nr:SprT family zinc-dependent metalloprotease [Deinococcus hopiensis]SMB95671.1 hypothetical protein SAMN00790413_02938 [Deinococcus hopiensis KR-140]